MPSTNGGVFCSLKTQIKISASQRISNMNCINFVPQKMGNINFSRAKENSIRIAQRAIIGKQLTRRLYSTDIYINIISK